MEKLVQADARNRQLQDQVLTLGQQLIGSTQQCSMYLQQLGRLTGAQADAPQGPRVTAVSHLVGSAGCPPPRYLALLGAG